MKKIKEFISIDIGTLAQPGICRAEKTNKDISSNTGDTQECLSGLALDALEIAIPQPTLALYKKWSVVFLGRISDLAPLF